MLLLELSDAASADQSRAACNYARAQEPEPPTLPERREYDHRDGCAFIIPDAIAVGRDHTEPVAAGRQIRVINRAARAGVEPAGVQPFQPVLEFDLVRLDVTQS